MTSDSTADLGALARLGLVSVSPEWEKLRTPGDDLVRVVVEHRGAYEVSGVGGTAWAELSGKSFRDARDKRDLPTVGDWLLVDRWAEACAGNGAAVIRTVLPRKSLLVRMAAGERTVPQPMAANVDVAFVVTSANLELSPRRLERYLAVARDAGVAPVLVLSKADLVSDATNALEQIESIAAGSEIIATSAARGEGVAQLRARLGRGTGVLLGSSGVGKSTLLNALLGEAIQETAAISADDIRGRHTTTRRALFMLGDGGVVIDTPGMRELAAWADDGDTDPRTALEQRLGELALQCKFTDCGHRDEPGCAVRAAIAAGTLEVARVEHAQTLAAERAVAMQRRVVLNRRETSRKSRLERSRRKT